MHPFNLSSFSIRSFPLSDAIQRILAASLEAVNPYLAVRGALTLKGSQLEIHNQKYNLAHVRRILVVGAGKAAAPMLQAAADVLGERLTQAVVVTKDGHAPPASPGAHLKIYEAGHPLPDERGVAAARAICSLLEGVTKDDLVLCLLSGGGSALLTQPAQGIDLADLQTLTSSLLRCGATINQVNTLRKHLDQLKGGGLARLAFPARVVSLILSDVVGDPLDVIASGPTVADPTTFADALEILDRYAILDAVPQCILQRLKQGAAGALPETPKPGDPLFERVDNHIIASNIHAANAALAQAQAEGLHTLLLTTSLQGEARQAGGMLAAICSQVLKSGQPIPKPACIIAGGETTVSVHGSGLGGRNQELALGAAAGLAGLSGALLVALATDGGDGPTDAGGAAVSGATLQRAAGLGMQAADFLQRNDAYHFFEPLDDLLRPGPTRTNVNDLAFLFVV